MSPAATNPEPEEIIRFKVTVTIEYSVPKNFFVPGTDPLEVERSNGDTLVMLIESSDPAIVKTETWERVR